jgi:hypothetical protein
MTTKLSLSELLERAKSEKIAVHTSTEGQAEALLKALDRNGYTWIKGEKLTDVTRYEDYGRNTCYNFEPNKKIMYDLFCFYQYEGYVIIECGDINFEEE